MKQNIRRLDRRGQTKRVKAYALQYASQDTRIFEKLGERTEVIEQLLGTKSTLDLTNIKQGKQMSIFKITVSTVLDIEAKSFDEALAIMAGKAVAKSIDAVATETTPAPQDPTPAPAKKTGRPKKEEPAKDIAAELSDGPTPDAPVSEKKTPTLTCTTEEAIKAMQNKTKEIMKNPKNQCDTMKFLAKLNEYLRVTHKVAAIPEVENPDERKVAATAAVILFNDMLGVTHGTLDILSK
jgi:hypothetical protein